MDSFSLGTEIIAGAGAISALSRLGAKRVMVAAEPKYIQKGWAEQAARASGAAHYWLFPMAGGEPTLALASEGAEKRKEWGADGLIVLGDGAVLDMGKAIACLGSPIPMAAVPTVSGSGAETSSRASLIHEGVRHQLKNEGLRPRLAILDSDLLGELTRQEIAQGGFDILAHALESCCAAKAGTISGLFAREAFRSAYGALPASYGGRGEVRLKIHLASALAGAACSQSGLGLCHALANSLGSLFPVPHGSLCAILLPAVMNCNAHAALKQYADLARSAGIVGSGDTTAFRNLKGGLVRLRSQLELPQTLGQAGIHPRTLWSRAAAITEKTLADPCCADNPLIPDDFLIRRILEEVSGPARRLAQ